MNVGLLEEEREDSKRGQDVGQKDFWKKSERTASEGRMSARRRMHLSTRGVFRDFSMPLPTASAATVFCSNSTTTHLQHAIHVSGI